MMLSNADFALEGAGQSPQVPARGKYRLRKSTVSDRRAALRLPVRSQSDDCQR